MTVTDTPNQPVETLASLLTETPSRPCRLSGQVRASYSDGWRLPHASRLPTYAARRGKCYSRLRDFFAMLQAKSPLAHLGAGFVEQLLGLPVIGAQLQGAFSRGGGRLRSPFAQFELSAAKGC